MQEYVTDAIVLRKDPRGDLDGRYTLFTKRFGKIAGRATSSRKITSKLAPHLEPGMVAKVRFVEAKGTQIIDALKLQSERIAAPLADLHLLSQLMPEAEPEPMLWEELFTIDANANAGVSAAKKFSWRRVLAILGWDPDHAHCATCGADVTKPNPPEYFYIPRQEFYCRIHASKARHVAVSLIHAL